MAVFALGLGIGIVLDHRTLRPAGPPTERARLQTVIAHERAKGNAVVEADVPAGGAATVDLPKGTFAVFAAPAVPGDDHLVLDGGAGVDAAVLVRLAKGALPNTGLSARWTGSLTLRLGAKKAAHLAFFATPKPAL